MRTLACLLAVLCAVPAIGAERITATITVTNLPANSQTLVVNSDTRTWYDTVTNIATEVATAASGQAAATNLWLHIARSQFAGPIVPSWVSTNEIALQGASGLAMALTASGWVPSFCACLVQRLTFAATTTE